jgi:hypothetical protein
MSTEELYQDLASRTIEGLTTRYVLGDTRHPLRWLFAAQTGFIPAHLYRRVRQERRRDGVLFRLDDTDFHQGVQRLNRWLTDGVVQTAPDCSYMPREYDEAAELRTQTSAALRVLEDGVTLPVAQYRVLRFCLNNAQEHLQEASHMTSGLHQHLADHAGRPRRWASRQYARAWRRLLDATGHSQGFLAARGLHIPTSPEATRRRRDRLLRRPQLNSNEQLLSEEEIQQLLRTQATAADLAWAYGISEDLVYRLRRRFKETT